MSSFKPKYTLSDMKTIAAENEGRCLSREYKGFNVPLAWQCKRGHTWDMMPDVIKNGAWCPSCSGHRVYTIKDMQWLAKERGGKCISKTYINKEVKLKWECAKKHRWESTPGSVRQGKWCHECSGLKLKTIEQMQELAKAKGGVCLSRKYIDILSPLLWKCAKGHVWKARPRSITGGHWCLICKIDSSRKHTINDLQNLAVKKGGKCLSKTFTSVKVKLKWECKEGHTWQAKTASILRGSWCRICARKK